MQCSFYKCTVEATQTIMFTSGMKDNYCTPHAATFDPETIEERTPVTSSKKRVRIVTDNEVMIYMNTDKVYSSDELPGQFKSLQPIIEDWLFISMTIHFEGVHYQISIES